ncbi:MAG TPA: response regulator transcription factor [Thermoanaerobaculaceae bacterium]|nr:response regulator transcription factor [Thermoanaerobaculaceae bacterium]
MIRLVLVDDQTLVRRGIRGLLELTEDIVVIGEAGDGGEALDLVAAKSPDVLLLDVRMPVLDGIEVVRRLAAAHRLPPTILLTTFDDDEALLAGMRAGARGFLLKDVTLETLTDAIRAVARGETLIRPAVTERALKALEQLRPELASLDRPDPLTPREIEVLRLLAAGWSNREIAGAIGTREGTVKNHISSVLSKLGVRDRTRAVLRGLELRLI